MDTLLSLMNMLKLFFLFGTIHIYNFSKRTGWVGSKKWPFLMTFCDVFILTSSVGRSEKVQKYAYVIFGWFIIQKRAKNTHTNAVDS